MAVIDIHNVTLHYGINQPMISVKHVVLLWLKRHIKMVQLKSSVPMKHVQLDHQSEKSKESKKSSKAKKEETTVE